MKDIVINDRYRVDFKIGEGGFGLVYTGTDLHSKEEVAIKLMDARDELDILQNEAETYTILSGGAGIPCVLWHGWEGDYYVLVHELLGPSLEDLLEYCDRRFSLKTVLLVADQAISRVEYIHNKGFLHCDVKPDNFLLGVEKRGNTLYTIDFGLAREMRQHRRHSPLEGRSFIGTRRYASVNSHNGQELSWRDDMESLGYVLLYCCHGSLPWQGLEAADDKGKDELVKHLKSTVAMETLCRGLPDEFTTYMNYVRSLEFNERPKYAYLRRLFSGLFEASGFKHDNVFDWTEKRFDEMQGEA